MKYILFDGTVSKEEIKEMIKNKNECGFNSLGGMLYSVLSFYKYLDLEDLKIEPFYYDEKLEHQVYMVYSRESEFTARSHFFIEVS